jgi:hypothetical protein
MEKVLKHLYTSPSLPSSYSGVQKLWTAARKQFPQITHQQVRDFLKTQHSYTLHRRVVRKFPRLRTIPSGLNTDWQADTLDLQRLSRNNRGYKYVLVVVDVLSRFVYLEPTKSKKSEEMVDAFTRIFKRAKSVCWRLYSDAGTEMKSAKLNELYKKWSIRKVQAKTNPTLHGTMVERMNRTIRDRLRRYFTEKATLNWIDVIQDIAKSINNSVHSVTNMRPSDVNPANADLLWDRQYRQSGQTAKIKFKVGDTVRIERQRLTFNKHNTNFTDEIFYIHKVLKWKTPVVYQITDVSGEVIEGYFYASELCPAAIDSLYRVEKVLRYRTLKGQRQVYVKWLGLGYNSWIAVEDLV